MRKKQKEANGVLDKHTIQAALGKCQPRQRMWGVSGNVILGVKIEVPVEQQLALLEFLMLFKKMIFITCVLLLEVF